MYLYIYICIYIYIYIYIYITVILLLCDLSTPCVMSRVTPNELIYINIHTHNISNDYQTAKHLM